MQVPPERANGPLGVNVPAVSCVLPVLETETLCTVLVVPVAQVPKPRLVGDTVAVRVGVVPVPLNTTGALTTGTEPAIATLPVTEPTVVGANLTVIVQLAPAARVAPQPPAARVKPVPDTVMPVMLNGAPPLLDNVSALVGVPPV